MSFTIKITHFTWQETTHLFGRYLLNACYVPGTSLGIWDTARTKYILICSFQEQRLPWQRALWNLLERKWLTSSGVSIGPAVGNWQQISHGVFWGTWIFQSSARSCILSILDPDVTAVYLKARNVLSLEGNEITLNWANWIHDLLSHRGSLWWSWLLFPLPCIRGSPTRYSELLLKTRE